MVKSPATYAPFANGFLPHKPAQACRHCRLPLGELAYIDKKAGRTLVHGECMAQILLHDMRTAESSRLEEQAKNKLEKRQAYGIGWDFATAAPSNVDVAAQDHHLGEQGMCCIIQKKDTGDSGGSVSALGSIEIDATDEPSAAVNLEYLAIALKCRILEGREPVFSLDPSEMHATPSKDGPLMYKKRYEPSWLAGTSVGELLFQADYYLKELSMGECPQPVLGMRSAFDYSAMDPNDQIWKAREWFTVLHAEVAFSEDHALIPCVSLGVEAREQVIGAHGLEDAKVTSPSHPLVKHAADFSHNMHLIAERRSVIFHLRELSKAVVLAKFLVEKDADVEDLLAMCPEHTSFNPRLEAPLQWCDHPDSKILVSDGKVVEDEAAPAQMRSVYGGIDLGLSLFTLFGGAPIRQNPGASWAAMNPGFEARPPQGYQPPIPELRFEVPPHQLLGPLPQPTMIQPAPVRARRRPAGVSIQSRAKAAAGRRPQRARPQGVDLGLDNFDVSTPSTAVFKAVKGAASSNLNVDEATASNADHFAAILESTSAELSDIDQSVLERVFHPCLSDRACEGKRFIPPDTSTASMRVLSKAVEAEDRVREQREAHFASADFQVDNPGPLFPATWKCGLAIGALSTSQPALQPRPDLVAEDGSSLLTKCMRPSNMVFERRTEDGSYLRVYKVGDLEVRTLQDDTNTAERPVAAFSPRQHVAVEELPRFLQSHDLYVDADETILKVSEYVEHGANSSSWGLNDELADQDADWFVVLSTEQGHLWIVEMLDDGSITFGRSTEVVERMQLAKATRCSASNSSLSTAGLARKLANLDFQGDARGWFSQDARQHFAQLTYDVSAGSVRLAR